MKEISLQEAVENLSLIKEIINRTRKSFAAFSKIFIYWGLLFILNGVMQFFMISNKEKALDIAMRYPVLNYLFPIGVISLLAFLIYRAVAKKIPLVGLEKKLMTVWLLILVMNIIPPKVNINTATAAVNSVTISYDNLSTMLFSLATALIVTALFTGYNQLSNLGIVYITLSVLHAYLNIPIFTEGTLTQLLTMVVLPFTFLYTGFFLRSRQARGI